MGGAAFIGNIKSLFYLKIVSKMESGSVNIIGGAM